MLTMRFSLVNVSTENRWHDNEMHFMINYSLFKRDRLCTYEKLDVYYGEDPMLEAVVKSTQPRF